MVKLIGLLFRVTCLGGVAFLGTALYHHGGEVSSVATTAVQNVDVGELSSLAMAKAKAFAMEHYTAWEFWAGVWAAGWMVSIPAVNFINKARKYFKATSLPAHSTAMVTLFWPVSLVVGVAVLLVLCLGPLYENRLGCACDD